MANKTNTTVYTWPASDLIRRIEVRQQSNGRAVVYIDADTSDAAREARQNIRAALRLKGWGTLSDHHDEKFQLRVSGLRSGEELLAMLRAEGFITTEPTVSTIAQKVEKPQGFWNYVKAHSLTISGTVATIGNFMSIGSGFARGKEIGQIGQGAAFALADLPLAIAGERDDSRQLSNLLRELKTHYHKIGVEIPKNSAIEAETSDRGKTVGERTQDFLHRYANQIKCSLEVVAAVFTIHAGKAQNSSFKKYSPYVWGSGFLASLLIPEKKIDAEKYQHAGLLGRAWMKIQSNPLSIGGTLGYANTVATYGSAIKERKASLAPGGNGRHLYRWDFAIPTVMISANGTYAISKKTVGGDIQSDEMVSDVYSVAAQILNKQPEGPARDAAIESTAKFLGERPEIKDTHQQIIVRLRKEMEIQNQNPWFEKLVLPPRNAGPTTKVHHAHAEETVAGLSAPAAELTAADTPKSHTDTLAEQRAEAAAMADGKMAML